MMSNVNESANKVKLSCDGSISSSGSNGEASLSSSTNRHDKVVSSSSTTSRKRVVDETQLPPDEAEKVLARRAYNRECATRARKRNKLMVAQLQKQVKELQEDKDALRRSLTTMEKQMVQLENQNKSLLLQQMAPSQRLNDVSFTSDNLGTPSLSAAALLYLQQQRQTNLLSASTKQIGGSDLSQLSRYMMNNQSFYN